MRTILAMLAATLTIAATPKVVVMEAPESVELSAAQKSAIMAMVLKKPDTGNFDTGEPTITSNTVDHTTWKDYVFTELQTGYAWDEAWRSNVQAQCRLVNTNISVYRAASYTQFKTDNNRVPVE